MRQARIGRAMRLTLAALGLAAHGALASPAPGFDLKMVLDGVPPERTLEAVADAYRVAPDRRFLDAFGALDAILAGRPAAPPTLEKRPRGAWAVVRNGATLALLPDAADFAPLWAALVAHARKLAPQAALRRTASAGAAQCVPFLAPGAWTALEKAERAWLADRDEGALALAARCLVALSVQQLDEMEIGDALPARALAALAAYHAVSDANVDGELALLAEAMGYRASARALAQRLPPDEPARRAAAQYYKLFSSRTTADGVRLVALRARYSADEDRGPLAASRELPYTVLRAVWEHGGGGSAAQGKPLDESRSLLWSVARTLPRVLRISEEELVPAFERLLERAVQRRTGPFADGEVLAAWYRGYFYSALFTMGRHHLEQLSPARPADEFAKRLGLRPETLTDMRAMSSRFEAKGGFAQEFRIWYAAMAGLRLAKGPPETFMLPFLWIMTPRATATLFDELRSRFLHLTDTSFILMARGVFWRLDGRPSHRLPLAHLAYSTLCDGRLAGDLLEAALREAEAGATQGGATRASHDTREVLARLRAVSTDDLATLLEWLGRREPKPLAVLEQGYAALAARRPSDLRPLLGLAEVLEAGGRSAEARTALGRWLERNRGASPYDLAQAQVRIAELHYGEGDARGALAALAPALRWQGERALRLAALAADSIGDRQSAQASARELQQRHPWSHLAPLTAAELDWRHGAARAAAETLWEARLLVQTPEGMAAVAERFLAVFGETRPAAQAYAAFEALRERFHPFVLREIALAAQRAGRHRLAFELASRLRSPGFGGMELSFLAYQSLKRVEDGAAAFAWLRERLPRQEVNRIAQVAHRRGAPEVFASGLLDPDGEHARAMWLIRAAEGRLSPRALPDGELRARFAAPTGELYGALTRHLLGLADAAEVFRLAAGPQQRYTAAYFLGAKAESEGRVAEASGWYRAVLETGINTSEADRHGKAGDATLYRSTEWYNRMVETGVFFAPTELRWSLARLEVLREQLLAAPR